MTGDAGDKEGPIAPGGDVGAMSRRHLNRCGLEWSETDGGRGGGGVSLIGMMRATGCQLTPSVVTRGV